MSETQKTMSKDYRLSDDFYVTNDQLLVQPSSNPEDFKKAPSGLFIPVSVSNVPKQIVVIHGYVVRAGMGYPIWSEKDNLQPNSFATTWIPLTVKKGDEVYFLLGEGTGVVQIQLEGKPFYVIRQGHVLVAKDNSTGQ